MRALITGGAGYIGAHLVQRWIEQGGKALVVDDLSTGHADAVAEGAELIVADLSKAGEWQVLVHRWRPDVVFHFAAKSIVSESCIHPWRYLADNTAMTLNLLHCIPKDAIFVYSSSCALYGGRHREPLNERIPPAPESPYAESKAIGERLVRAWCKEHEGRAVALRYFNVVGCAAPRLRERHEPETHLVPNLLEAAKSGGSFRLYGVNHPTPDGTAIRDFVDVSDLVEAHIAAAERLQKMQKSFFDVFNLGCGRGISVREAIAIAERITQRAIRVEVHPPRPGDAPMLVAATEKWQRWCGIPKRWRSLEESMQAVWEAMHACA